MHDRDAFPGRRLGLALGCRIVPLRGVERCSQGDAWGLPWAVGSCPFGAWKGVALLPTHPNRNECTTVMRSQGDAWGLPWAVGSCPFGQRREGLFRPKTGVATHWIS